MSTKNSLTTSIPWRSSTLQVVLLTTFIAPFSIALISPGLPVFRDAFSLTDPAASLLLSTIVIPGIFLSPLVGLLTDRVGRRRVLLSSLVLWSLAGGFIALAPPFWLVLTLRLVQGIALAGLGITTITLISDVFEGVQRNAVFGVNTAILSMGAAAFPVVGGALVAVSWNAPFAMFLLGLPVALFALIVLDEPSGKRETQSSLYVRRVISALSAREAIIFYGSALIIDLLLFGAVFTALPFLLKANFGLSAILIGLVLTMGEVASIVAATQNGRLSQHSTDPRIIAVGFVATALGLGGVWFATSPVLIAISTVGFGAGWGLTLPSIDAGVSDLVRTEYRAGALSLRGSASSIGRAGGPIAFTTLSLQFGYRSLLLSAGIIALGFGVLVFALE
ncbi:MFS transporter [Halogeometricum sp. S1BR25-6]|uniref:MFS transporter n=1 Tax=Halogeometricum salsisoli TaxID=2950536 RepID=A0ABU2GJU0_9EURY|nr:MFS transporter [Halogeometricum sp. S1BR25-6]MDS0301092.1 MFS transporter [Halogeometricum sp. S1BR25-6]